MKNFMNETKQKSLFAKEVFEKQTPANPIARRQYPTKPKEVKLEKCVVLVNTLFLNDPVTNKLIEHGVGEIVKIPHQRAQSLAKMQQVKILPSGLLAYMKR